MLFWSRGTRWSPGHVRIEGKDRPSIHGRRYDKTSDLVSLVGRDAEACLILSICKPRGDRDPPKREDYERKRELKTRKSDSTCYNSGYMWSLIWARSLKDVFKYLNHGPYTQAEQLQDWIAKTAVANKDCCQSLAV
eukprot:5108560-Amphidinium_carterae.2